ncbi:MAG: hypothetical protein JSV74_01675, partial [Dehalococcoidia bacterium]
YPAVPVYSEKGWHTNDISFNGDLTYLDASFYLVRLSAPSKLVVATSGTEIDHQIQDNRQINTYVSGPSRDFYVAASENFVQFGKQIEDLKVSSYAFAELENEALFTVDTAIKAVESFNTRLGDYPYSELDIVSLPIEGALGVEYPGTIGISQDIYGQDVVFEATIAHEVGHQWLYNAVGNDPTNEPWLDESLVQYLTGLYFLDYYGEMAWQAVYASWIDRWDRVNLEEIPIRKPIGEYSQEEYGAIIYGRGPLFVDELAQTMGLTDFNTFLRHYYLSQKWGIATTSVFRQLAEGQCNCDLTTVFSKWIFNN